MAIPGHLRSLLGASPRGPPSRAPRLRRDASRLTPKSAPSAPSPSIPPTSGKSSGSGCRKASTSSSSCVERGRPDWLRFGLQAGVRCDLLVDFRALRQRDRVLLRPGWRSAISLAVAEMERASCSDSCPGVFSQLKGGLSLRLQHDERGAAHDSTSAEAERSLMRSGYSLADAQRLARALDRRHGREQPRSHAPHLPERSRDLRLLRLAPLGPTAATLPQPLLRFGVASRRRQRPSGSGELLGQFAAEHDGRRERLDGGRSRRGIPEGNVSVRRRAAVARGKARLHPRPAPPRHGGSAGMFLDRIEKLYASLTR